MPTYAYECSNCGHTFDAFQSMKAEPLTTCPACGTTALRRLIGAGAGLLFKGSGFYITDYRKSSPPAASGSGESAKSSGSGGGGNSSSPTPTSGSSSGSPSTPGTSSSKS